MPRHGGGPGVHPLDVELGLTRHTYSPLVIGWFCRLATRMSFQVASGLGGRFLGAAPPASAIEPWVLGLARPACCTGSVPATTKSPAFFWKADREKQRQFVRKYRRHRREAGPTTRRYFVDACHPVWGLELLYCCWLLVGQRHYVGVGSGRKRLNILGAYSPDDHDYVDLRLTKENITGEQFVKLLEKLLAKHPETEKFILYLDNAKYYSKAVVKEWLARHRQFRLVFLPAYSPTLIRLPERRPLARERRRRAGDRERRQGGPHGHGAGTGAASRPAGSSPTRLHVSAASRPGASRASGAEERRKKGDKSKHGRSATLVVMYTLRRGEDGRLPGPINKKVFGTFGSRQSALEWAQARRRRRAAASPPEPPRRSRSSSTGRHAWNSGGGGSSVARS